MIRTLVEADNEVVFAYLTQNPALNLFIIGDIEAFGYEQAFQELWGEFTEDGLVKAVLLRYHNTFIISAEGICDAEGFASIIRSYEFDGFSGSEDAVAQLELLLPLEGFRKTDSYFAECTTAEHATLSTNTEEVQMATLEDVDRIIEVRKSIKEFNIASDARGMLQQSIETKTGRTYYIEQNGKMISLASTTAENSLSGMIVGVATVEEARQKGYVTHLLEHIIRDLIAEKKTLCLFYNNPSAGRIYKRLGFEDIGHWRMYRK
ncbi:GNAT family N-acetyltransferase [Priestia taiwanensis]|uniref:N-acetyltransferase n=1 Tax=Priestia taiwanensis TaxID=1347902 RepID=A0A917AWQ4_9BACI|nr:GNAT family N-acetyltransferase [Priestia taiwanensis]MBM7364800.1 putative GNAT family acetyltransferase [Priestia taiwanensis]GGE79795.1 N-acetyltransferase [Priestia taiwanensis]